MSGSSFPKNIYDLALALPNYLRDIKNYDFKQSIGKGGCGEVFLGTDKTTKKKVAIKRPLEGRIPSNFSSLYIREIYIMAKMNSISPYFVSLAGYTIEAPYCIVTDYMSKGSLHKYYQLNTANPIFNGTQSQIIAIQILLGINSMHSRGFIHRDLKLSNILLDQDNIPRIADLGMSRMKSSNNLMTVKIGTLHTMAPEVYNGQPYTYSADVYSFGVILYSMNERRAPTQNMTKNELRNGSLFRTPSFRYTNATSQAMRDLIDSCIRYNPEERPTIQAIVGKLLNGEANFSGAKPKKVFQYFNKHTINNFVPPKLPDQIPDYQERIHRLEKRYKTYLSKMRQNNQNKPKTTPKIEKKSEIKEKSFLETFYEEFTKEASNVTPENFDTFYDTFIKQPLENDQFSKCYELIVSVCNSIIENDANYIQLFSKKDYEKIFPLSSQSLMTYAIEYLGTLFTNYPDNVSMSTVKLTVSLIEEKPFEMATIFSYYVKNFGTVKDPFPLTDTFLINYNCFFNDSDSAQTYLSIIYNLASNFPIFCQKRLNDVKTIISESFNYKESMQYGLQLTALIYSPQFKDIVPLNLIINGLNDKSISDICVSLLLRFETIPFSKELYTNVLNKSKSDKKCSRVLFKLSECSKECFVDDLSWLLLDLPTIDETFTLFLSIFRHNECRDKICLSEQFISFLMRVVQSSNSYYLSALPSLLRRFNMSKEFAEKIQKNGFFKLYFESAIKLNDPELNMKAAILLDQTCRIFFTNDLLIFMQRLREMVSIREQADIAISVSTSLSYFPPFRESLIRYGFVPAFQYLMNSQNYKDKAAMFLKNIGS